MKKEYEVIEVLHRQHYLKQAYESKLDAMSQKVTQCGCRFCTLAGKKNKGVSRSMWQFSILLWKNIVARENFEDF